MLEEEHRIGIADRRFDQAFRVVSRRRLDNLQSRSVQEKRLRVERMKRPRTYSRSAWTTKHRRNAGAPAISTLRRVVCQQIEARGNEIDKLKLSDRSHAHQRCATRCADDRAFRDRRVDHAFLAKLIDQSVSDFERAAIRADVFTDHKHGWIAFHLLPNTLANGLNERGLSTTFRARRFMFFFDGSRHC